MFNMKNLQICLKRTTVGISGLNIISYRAFSSVQPGPVKVYENAQLDRKTIMLENKDKVGVYLWTNKINGKRYVGSSINLSSRFLHYFSKSYLSSINTIIYKALLKYGHENFSFSILEYCDLADVIDREQFYLDTLKPEYNILTLAYSLGGFKHSEESKRKMSEARLGRKGNSHTEESKAMLSEAGKGNKNRSGKSHTEEQRAKISASQPTAQRVEVVDLDENISNYYNSTREASKAIGCSKDTISKYIQNNKIYKGKYKIKKAN